MDQLVRPLVAIADADVSYHNLFRIIESTIKSIFDLRRISSEGKVLVF